MALRELFKLLWERKGRVALGLGALLIVDGGQLLVPLLMRAGVDAIAQGRATPGLLARYGLYLVGIALIVAFFRFFWRYFLFGAARDAERQLRDEIYAHILRLHPGFFLKKRTGEVMALATNDADAVRMALGMGVIALTDALFVGLFSLGAMLAISYKLSLYVLTPMLLLAISTRFFGKLIYQRFKEVQESFAELTERVREALSGIKVIKAFAQEPGELGHFEKFNQDYVNKNLRLVKVWGLFQPLMAALAGLGMALVLWFGGRQVIYGQISLGDMVAFAGYLGMMVWPMIAIGLVVNWLQRGVASLRRIKALLVVEPEIKDPPKPYAGPVKGEVEFRDLTLEADGRLILKGVSVKVERGMTLGIVGRTGAGKTQLVQTVPRLVDPPPGKVFVDGVDVRQWKLASLRRGIGFVPQEAFLFSMTIRENIAFFNPDASEEEIIRAAKLAEIWEEIEAMPKGLDTVVGERGVTLSGGQRQRVALARAILADPPLLILDDTLSAVDAETEKAILKNLKPFLAGRTALIISHRLSAVADADWIIVLERGEVIEEGTHRELLEKKGLYWRMWQLQELAGAVA